jgi:uncharacterized membrane protein
MKNKIRLIAYSISSSVLAAPALTFAQISTPRGTGLPSSSVFEIISSIMYWLLALVGIIGVIGFAIAGLIYLTAAGDEDRISKAKSALTYSIIGVIVALLGLVALNFAKNLLGAGSEF